MTNATFQREPNKDNMYRVIYQDQVLEGNLPRWVAKLLANKINEVTGKPAIQVAANIWTVEKIIELGLRMKILITEAHATEMIKKLNRLDDFVLFSLNGNTISQTIWDYYQEPSMQRQQAKDIWIAYKNQFINAEGKFIDQFLDYEPGTHIGIFLSWYQGTFQLDIEKLNNHIPFENAQLL